MLAFIVVSGNEGVAALWVVCGSEADGVGLGQGEGAQGGTEEKRAG